MDKKTKTKNMVFQQGAVAIIFSVLLLVVLLVIGLGISAVLLQQVKLSRQTGESVVAFYAADAGAERCLYEVRKNAAVTCPSGVLDNGASYTVDYNGSDTVTSLGRFRATSREVELTWD